MCSTEAVMIGGKVITDIKKEQEQTTANITRANQTNEANRVQALHINESLKAKLVSSLKQEAQETVKTAKKIQKASIHGRMEIYWSLKRII